MAQPALVFFFLLTVTAVAARDAPLVSPVPIGQRYIVGGANGWRVPRNKDMYIKWAAGIQFYVEDSIEFMYKNDSVAKVDKYAYYHCNSTAPAGTSPAKDGSSLFLLDTPGYAYFASADAKHCKKGQRLMVNVKARQAPAPAPAPETEEIPTPPAPAPLPSSPAPAPRRPVMENGAAALASTSSRALVFLAALALMGLIRA